jgi:hypothetical protein
LLLFGVLRDVWLYVRFGKQFDSEVVTVWTRAALRND